MKLYSHKLNESEKNNIKTDKKIIYYRKRSITKYIKIYGSVVVRVIRPQHISF